MSSPAEGILSRLAPQGAGRTWVFEDGRYRSDLSRPGPDIPGERILSLDGGLAARLDPASAGKVPWVVVDLCADGTPAAHSLALGERAELEVFHVVAARDGGRAKSALSLELGRGSVLRHAEAVAGDAASGDLGFRASLDRDSRLDSRRFLLQGRSWNAEILAELVGAGAQAEIAGLVAVDGERTARVDAQVRHATERASSRQVFQALAGGKAKAAFEGKVLVDPGAKGTDARQSSRNILLSREASIDSMPRLEIREDDVKCSHGSTTGRLDEGALRFLRARGFSPEGARALLVRAFAGEQVEALPEGWFRDLVESMLEGIA